MKPIVLASLITGTIVGTVLFVTSTHTPTPHDYPGITVHLAGDSTMSTKLASTRPDTGWGEPFAAMICDSTRVVNHARNGRSTKSFLSEGLWKNLVSRLREGDVVLIQFGHNDQKVDKPLLFADAWHNYKDNLQSFVNDSQNKGANPVLLTSIARRAFDSNNVLQSTLGEYPAATRELAREMSVPLIDLNAMTRQLIKTMGPEASKALFLHLPPGVNSNYPEGSQDDTHLNARGALEVAAMAAVELKKSWPDVICH